MNEACPYCDGTGLLTKKSHILYEIEEWIKKYKQRKSQGPLALHCHPSIAEKLREGTVKAITKLQLKNFVRIKLIEDEKLSVKQFKFIAKRSKKDITDDYL